MSVIEENSIADNLTYHTIENGSITVVTIKTVLRESVDAWSKWTYDRIANWQDNKKPYLVLYDMTYPNVSFTPYMRGKATETNDLRQDVKGKIALYLTRSTLATLMSLFARLRRSSSRQLRIFFNYDEAVAWLKEDLSE